MAFLGHHIVEQGLARLAALMPLATGHAHVLARRPALHFRAARPVKPEPETLKHAARIYAGETDISAEEFDTLEWLETLAASGRHLQLCHALGLLEEWNRHKRERREIAVEAGILRRLTFSAGQCAAMLQKDQLTALAVAMQAQISRLLRLKAHSPTENRIRAIALLQASDVQEDGKHLQTEALRLLEQVLPQTIASDGGPLCDQLKDYVDWLQPLLRRDDLPCLALSRNALDRARPFLSMLVGAHGRYSFAEAETPLPAVSATASLRLAPQSGVARLASGKFVAIAMPSQLNGTTTLEVTSHGRELVQAGLFLHGPDDEQSVFSLEHENSDAGQLLLQQTACQQRTIFLSPKGDDLRVEDRLNTDMAPTWMRLGINAAAKVSVARNGTQATIAMDSRNLWQLSLRGAALIAPQQGHIWLMKASGNRINWALKRINRTAGRSEKAEIPELPF